MVSIYCTCELRMSYVSEVNKLWLLGSHMARPFLCRALTDDYKWVLLKVQAVIIPNL